MRRRSALFILIGCFSAVLGCSSEHTPNPFVRCGDGRLDPGEECDDCNVADNDSCLSTCVKATCGDGFVDLAHEVCDRNNLTSCGPQHTAPCTCADLGFAAGTLRCSG